MPKTPELRLNESTPANRQNIPLDILYDANRKSPNPNPVMIDPENFPVSHAEIPFEPQSNFPDISIQWIESTVTIDTITADGQEGNKFYGHIMAIQTGTWTHIYAAVGASFKNAIDADPVNNFIYIGTFQVVGPQSDILQFQMNSSLPNDGKTRSTLSSGTNGQIDINLHSDLIMTEVTPMHVAT